MNSFSIKKYDFENFENQDFAGTRGQIIPNLGGNEWVRRLVSDSVKCIIVMVWWWCVDSGDDSCGVLIVVMIVVVC